ncbi:uncharacterized protein LOC9660532 [Selaginella moellendorffii]|uniref:uncharacterized protein LOC9660532 n=1 Tax=Selaginella moellendorffii TaxID=88036 RepID=UPI000D1C5318|nr:uncharacterized protein LOC9660532 [Selaginella moellendorffii]|eukprot:XP_024520508.1 uncharacterized protein LOC9660532 [Selaginella moellendorffii]
MDSLLGKSILAAFPRSRSQALADAAARPCAAKVSNGQQPASTSSSATNSGTLPLPPRSSLPGPLKFLWFSKNQGEISPSDPFSVAESLETSNASGELLVGSDAADEKVIDPNGRSWAQNIWGLRALMGRSSIAQEESGSVMVEDDTAIPPPSLPPRQGIPESESGNLEQERAGAQSCLECEVDGCSIESSSMLEVPHVQVSHTRESFSKFLQPVSLREARVIARMSHLCNLAYRVGDIEPSNLLHTHGLEFMTSSLVKKEEALAKEQASSVSSNESEESDGGSPRIGQRFSISPASAYSVASAVASYLHSQTTSLLRHRKKVNEAAGDALKDQRFGAVNGDGQEKEAADYESSEMATLIASSPVTAVVAAKEGTKDAVAKDLQSLHNCPCEWYCCDDRKTSTLHFVIQGSESLASWQANLLFEPTHFEDSSLGVFVHRGIYEAAKGLYEQLLPCVLEHLRLHGDQARLCFTGHSLGGSLATLVFLMLRIRGVVQREALLPVLTFGSPCILCGGDYLLDKLGLPKDHIRSVMLHRDIVPRTFACNYPDHVAEILKRLNGNFRDHPCLNNQKLLYAPMGQFILLQPSEDVAPPHPLLPPGLGLYVMRHPREGNCSSKVEFRAAQRAFLNSPHPLEILSDPGAYGSDGAICRDHDPRSYMKCITGAVRQEAKRSRRLKRQQRRGLWWPLITAELSSMFRDGGGGGGGGQDRTFLVPGTTTAGRGAVVLSGSSAPGPSVVAAERFYAGVVRGIHEHRRQGQVVLLFFFSVKLALMQGFAAFFAWV